MQECEYCLKEINHGGKCYGQRLRSPCLLYERDPRGRWARKDARLLVDFGDPIRKPREEFVALWGGIRKTIKIYNIHSVEWERNKKTDNLKGIIMFVDVGYWTEENGVITNKPVLKLVK